jgi:hypothetical protein
MEWSKVRSKKLKMVSAGIGASAVVAMGALGVAYSDVSTAQTDDPPGPATTSEAPTGQTVTTTTPPTAPPTSKASPTVSATTPSGFATPH